MNITVSKVTRNSDNAKTLRSACDAAIAEGRSVEITEEFTNGDWWTTFKIEWPDNRTVIDCSLGAIEIPEILFPRGQRSTTNT